MAADRGRHVRPGSVPYRPPAASSRVKAVEQQERHEHRVTYVKQPPFYWPRETETVRVQRFSYDPSGLCVAEVGYNPVRRHLADGFIEDIFGAVRCPLCSRQWFYAVERYDCELSCRCNEMVAAWTAHVWEPRACTCMHEPRAWAADGWMPDGEGQLGRDTGHDLLARRPFTK